LPVVGTSESGADSTLQGFTFPAAASEVSPPHPRPFPFGPPLGVCAAVRSGSWVCRPLPAVFTASRSSALQLAAVRRPRLLPQAWPASRSRPRGRSRTRRSRTAPLGVVSAPSTTLRSGPLHPGLPHLARSVLEVRASSTVCSLMRVCVPEGTLAVRGVRSQDTLCAVGCASVATAAVRIGQSCARVSARARRLARTLVARHACGARCAPSSSSEEPRGRGPLRHAVGRSVPWSGSRGPGVQEVVLTFR
jgi:hypothetical protein